MPAFLGRDGSPCSPRARGREGSFYSLKELSVLAAARRGALAHPCIERAIDDAAMRRGYLEVVARSDGGSDFLRRLRRQFARSSHASSLPRPG